MANISKAKKGPAKKSVKKTPKKKVISLPTEKRKPSNNPQDFTWLIYGDKKIGKTSLSSCFPNSLIYSFEPGAKAIEAFAVEIPDWQTALDYNEELFSTENDFQNVIIDTGMIAYDRNQQHVCNENNISYPGDLPHGKGWSILKKSFEKMHLDITSNGLGLIILAHDKVSEIELPSGLKTTRIEPVMSNGALGFYQGMVDIIGHYHYIGDKRFLQIRGNEDVVCGCRMKHNFLTPKGERIIRIPMGNSEQEAFENVMKAFNNEQTETFANVSHKTKSKVKKRH